jgi:hypothetical protein
LAFFVQNTASFCKIGTQTLFLRRKTPFFRRKEKEKFGHGAVALLPIEQKTQV